MNDDCSGMEVDLGGVENRSAFSFDRAFEIPVPGGGKAEVTTVTTVDVMGSGTRYDLAVRVRGDVHAECHRCLASFHLPVETTFDVVLRRGEQVTTPAQRADEEDLGTIPVVGEGRYDIFPRVREAVILEIPIKLLCRDDCEGICRRCGANLNEGDCGCAREPGDPRWEALKKFLNGEGKT